MLREVQGRPWTFFCEWETISSRLKKEPFYFSFWFVFSFGKKKKPLPKCKQAQELEEIYNCGESLNCSASLRAGWGLLAPALQPVASPKNRLPGTGQSDAAGFPSVTPAMLWGWFPLASDQSEARD